MRINVKTMRILISCGYRLADCDKSHARAWRKISRARIKRHLARLAD